MYVLQGKQLLLLVKRKRLIYNITNFYTTEAI